MQLKVYSIRDAATEIFTQPFFNHTHGEAERNFKELVNRDDTTPSKNPEHFDLYHLGEYDDQSGLITPLPTPQFIIKAVQLKKS